MDITLSAQFTILETNTTILLAVEKIGIQMVTWFYIRCFALSHPSITNRRQQLIQLSPKLGCLMELTLQMGYVCFFEAYDKL